MKSFLFLYLLLPLKLYAIYYNSTMIEIEAKLFPKMIMLSENIDKNLSTINISIVARQCDYLYAKEFKENIESNYPDKLMNKTLEISINTFTELNSSTHAIIVLDHTQEEFLKIAEWANSRKILSFAYDPFYMEFGLLASLYIGVSTKPYLNKSTIQKYNFTFNPYLLELSKFK